MSNLEHNAELSRDRFIRALVGVGAIAGAILMVELALTRIFSVTMYYHFAFLAISIALFGLSASGVYVYVMRRTFDRRSTAALLTMHSLLFAVTTVLALAALVRIRVGLNYSHENLVKMIAIYTLAALPFFTGGAVISLAITRLRNHVNVVYGADLIGAAAGCLLLLPLLNRFGAPGVVLLAAVLGGAAALLFSPAGAITRTAALAALAIGIPGGLQLAGSAPFDVSNTKGHDQDTVLFAKWNSFSRVAVYDRSHGDWSLSSTYKGEKPETRFMDIDSAASTPIVRFDGDLSKVEYLKYELTGLAFHLLGNAPGAIFDRLRRKWLPERFHRPRHRTGRRTRPADGARVWRQPRRRRRSESDHRQRRHARTVPRVLRIDLSEPARPRGRRRWPQLHPAIERPLRHHPGLSRRHLGRHRGRRLHADREHALYQRSVRGLLRSPHRSRHADDYPLGVRRPAAGVARAGRVRKPRLLGRRSHGHRAAGSRRDVPPQEDALHAARRRTSAQDVSRPGVHGSVRARADRRGQRLREARARAQIDRRSTTPTITMSRRRQTTGHSSSTQRRSKISFTPRSGAACSSATVSAR